jgi:hypothetical protein
MNNLTKLNAKRKGIARAAYIANPSHCLWCEEAIPLKEGEKPYTRKRQKFCTLSHASLFRNRRIREAEESKYYENPNICDHCGSVIRIVPHEKIRDARAKRFCSHEHASLFNGTAKRNESIDEYNKNPNLCAQCGKAIPVKRKLSVAQIRERKFCHYPSPCAAMYNGNMKKAWARERPCQECGAIFKHTHNSRKHCRGCLMLDVCKRSIVASGIRQHAKWVMRESVKKCGKCDLTSPLERCHVKDVCLFPDSATLREVNARENLVYLCRNHHYEFDCIKTIEEKLLWLEGSV